MANHLKVAMIELILKLHGLRWSNRRIAHESAIPALETVRSRAGSSALCTAIEQAIRRINSPETP